MGLGSAICAAVEGKEEHDKEHNTPSKVGCLQALEEAAQAVAEQYEKKINAGSAAAINQIAVAFYSIAKKYEKEAKKSGPNGDEPKQKAEEFYRKAAEFFHKASDAGCVEATYNAGLAHNHLGEYEQAAACYRQCLNYDAPEILLKAASNFSLLLLHHNIPGDIDTVQPLLEIGRKYKGNKRADSLTETAMLILIDLAQDDSEGGPSIVQRKEETPAQLQKISLDTAAQVH